MDGNNSQQGSVETIRSGENTNKTGAPMSEMFAEPVANQQRHIGLAGAIPKLISRDDRTFDLMQFALGLWRRKFMVGLIAFLFAVAAVFYVYSVSPRYSATSVVMLDTQQPDTLDLTSAVAGLNADYFAIIAQEQVLTSRRLAGRVVDSLKLVEDPNYNFYLYEPSEPGLIARWSKATKEWIRETVGAKPPPERMDLAEQSFWEREIAIDFLLRDLTVTQLNSTYVYDITIESYAPEVASRIANKYAELYVLEQLEAKFEASEQANAWLTDRVAEVKAELEASESRLEEFMSSTSLQSEDDLLASTRQLKDMRERRENLLAQADQAQRVLAKLSGLTAADNLELFAQELGGVGALSLLAERKSLENVAGANAERRRQTLDLRILRDLEQQKTKLERDGLRAAQQASAMEASITDFEGQLDREAEEVVELRLLQREIEAGTLIYEGFLTRLKEASSQQGMLQPDARVVSDASIDLSPSYPYKKATVFMAIVLGCALGGALALWREAKSQGYLHADNLTRDTGLPVLGMLPETGLRSRKSLVRFATERSSSALMEAMRNLRTGLLMSNLDRPPQVVMVTSSLPKESKTTTALMLAINASQMGKRVLFMECDLRRQVMAKYFEMPVDGGLMAFLQGEMSFTDALYQDEKTGIDVLAGGKLVGNAADVLGSARFADLLGQLREHYDMIIIDTPPVLAVPDARVVAPLCDAITYCVRWSSTHKDLVREGLGSFAQLELPVAGLAVTRIVERRLAKFGQGYGEKRRKSKKYYTG